MNQKIKSFLLVLQTQLSNNKNLKGVDNLQRRLWCSVCANRGHLAETCQRQFNLKFPPNRMKITSYQNLYKPDQKQSTSQNNDGSLNYWDIHNISFNSKQESFVENRSNGSVNEILKCVDVLENQIKTMEISYRNENQTFGSNISESASSNRIVTVRTLESSRSTSRPSANNENQTRESNENLNESVGCLSTTPVFEPDPFTSTIYLTIKDLEKLQNFHNTGIFQNWIEKGVSFLINDTLSVPTFTIKGALMHKESVTATVIEFLYNSHAKTIKTIKSDLRLIFAKNNRKVNIQRLYNTISFKKSSIATNNLKLLNSYLFGNLNYEGRCTKEIEILRSFYDKKYPELTPEVTMAHRRVFLHYHGDYEQIIANLNGSYRKPVPNQNQLRPQKELAIKLVNELIAICADFNRKKYLQLLRKQLDNPNNPNATTVNHKNSTALRLVAKRMKYSGDISFLSTRKNKGC